ncbi:MAG: transglutaminase family protein [Rhodobacteraceae bacterium]|nr:transglutaminase family protein [Paracoccaceae bacterium]
MLYDIGLTIDYTYDPASGAGRHLLRLMPATLAGHQRLIAGRLSVDPAPQERRDGRDFWGNAVTEIAFRGGHERERFRLTARVDCTAKAPELDLSPPIERLAKELAEVRSLGPGAPHHFLGPSGRLRPWAEATAYARAQLQPGMTTLAVVEAVGQALHRDMTFDAEATTVDTDPAEAFARREGVCQDFSQIMIAALRGLGVPAGYVSGFLRTTPPEGRERLAGADAMHAWVRAWCGIEAGWVAYDPTNAVLAATDHVVVATGRDYEDVAPVRGVLRIAAAAQTRQEVDVIPLG